MEKIRHGCLVTIKYSMQTHFLHGPDKESPEEINEFVFGVEHQPPTLESALDDAGVGDKFNVHIPASEIYGEHDQSLIREIPKKGFLKQRLKEGRFYRQMRKGSLVSFKVLKLGQDTVLVDFNRPMAGISASMQIKVMDVRDASAEEIEAAHEDQLRKKIGCG